MFTMPPSSPYPSGKFIPKLACKGCIGRDWLEEGGVGGEVAEGEEVTGEEGKEEQEEEEAGEGSDKASRRWEEGAGGDGAGPGGADRTPAGAGVCGFDGEGVMALSAATSNPRSQQREGACIISPPGSCVSAAGWEGWEGEYLCPATALPLLLLLLPMSTETILS